MQEIKLFATTIAQTVGDGSLFPVAEMACPAPAAPRIRSTEIRKVGKQSIAIVADYGRAEAALAAFAKATGFEAVTLEQRLTNFLTHTHQRLGVPLRSMPR